MNRVPTRKYSTYTHHAPVPQKVTSWPYNTMTPTHHRKNVNRRRNRAAKLSRKANR